jgi:hypothetical protein
MLLAGLWVVVSALFAFQTSALGLLPWSSAAGYSLLDWGPWIVFGPIVLLLARKLPIGPKGWWWTIPTHVIASTVLVATMELTMTSLSLNRDLFRTPTVRSERWPSSRPKPDPVRAWWFRFTDRARLAIPVYWMLLAAAQAVAQQRRGSERENRAVRAEAHLAEARLMALQAQLNPHFLFNTLNTITQLVYDNPAAAEEMITSLSELLRAVLAAQHRRKVSLAEEMAFVERYCSIQKVRFADRLEVRYEIETGSLRGYVPTLLLQPLVENAIIHGVAPDKTPGKVFVRARVVGERLLLEVADTGRSPGGDPDNAGRPLLFKEGVGVSNTRARLSTLYGDDATFALERAIEGGVSAKIDLPLRTLET